MIQVDRDAQKTDGYQRNDNLILSESARADSIPGLEIQADDVKCSHGATAGRVDDEQVFYAQARGLTRKEAIRMIVAGFFQQVFDRIAVASVRQALGEAIGRRVREYVCRWTVSSGSARSATFPTPASRCSRSGNATWCVPRRRPVLCHGRVLYARRRAAGRRQPGRFHHHLSAARGQVRHPRRPRAVHARRQQHAGV